MQLVQITVSDISTFTRERSTTPDDPCSASREAWNVHRTPWSNVSIAVISLRTFPNILIVDGVCPAYFVRSKSLRQSFRCSERLRTSRK